MRSAIVYIQALKKLISDCDAGLVDSNHFTSKHPVLDSLCSLTHPVSNTVVRSQATKVQNKTNKVKNSKKVILDPKWTNYSQQYLQDKFSKDLNKDYSDSSASSPTSSSSSSSSDMLLSELSLRTLPNIEEILGGNLLENNANIVVQFQLIDDSSPAADNNKIDLDSHMEEFTDINGIFTVS